MGFQQNLLELVLRDRFWWVIIINGVLGGFGWCFYEFLGERFLFHWWGNDFGEALSKNLNLCDCCSLSFLLLSLTVFSFLCFLPPFIISLCSLPFLISLFFFHNSFYFLLFLSSLILFFVFISLYVYSVFSPPKSWSVCISYSIFPFLYGMCI